jgi:branched-chain amino acid transport system permease protein
MKSSSEITGEVSGPASAHRRSHRASAVALLEESDATSIKGPLARVWRYLGVEEIGLTTFVVIGAFVALQGSLFWTEFASTLVYFAILSIGLNIVLGLNGQLDFGHAVFFAIGAYTAAKLMVADPGTDFLIVVVVAAVAAGIGALLLGFPVFRMHGDFVALMTVALALIAYALINNIGWIGAANGILAIPVPHVLGISLNTNPRLLWFGIILFIISAAFVLALTRVRFGRALVALREDELAARCTGIRPLRYKIAAYVFAGILAGVAGAFFAGLFGFVGPASFQVNQSFLIAEAVILGGMGSVLGSVIGAAILVGLENLLVVYVPQVSGHQDLLIGVLVLLIIFFRPQGIFGKPFMKKRA